MTTIKHYESLLKPVSASALTFVSSSLRTHPKMLATLKDGTSLLLGTFDRSNRQTKPLTSFGDWEARTISRLFCVWAAW